MHLGNVFDVDGVKMGTKFKVGDVIRRENIVMDQDELWNRTVVEIFLEKKKTKYFSFEVDPCYILIDERGHYTYLEFSYEHLYSFISSSNIVSSCPNCNGELVEKYSEYVGGNIKKCKNCGYC